MGGMFGAIGAMAALAWRAVTGKDQAVQTALFKMNAFVVTQHKMQFAFTNQAALRLPSRLFACLPVCVGYLLRFHGQGRRADLSDSDQRHAMGAVLQGFCAD